MTRKATLALVPILLTQFAFFFFIAQHRFIDGDEGAFLLAARLVLAHKKPYLDFFYQQAPLLPYVYGIWMKFVGISWNAGRLLCVLLATLLGGLVYERVVAVTRNWLAGLSAVVLYASSALVFAWFTVVKTHCLAGILLFAAYTILSRSSEKFSHWLLAASGALLGLSVDTRSYVLLLVPIFLWWVLETSEPSVRRISVFWFCAGFVLGTLPATYFFVSSPDAFFFNNLRYHALRSDAGLIGWWQEKVFVLIELFLWGPEANGLQWSLLFFTSLAFVFSVKERNYTPRLAFQIAIVLGVVCLLPTPAYLQYFSLCIPFLAVSAVCAAAEFYGGLEFPREKRIVSAIYVVTLVAYALLGAEDFRSYDFTGNGVPGVHIARDRDDWTVHRVLEVSRAVDQIVSPGEHVASFWSGDIFQTQVQSIVGLESPFSLPVSDKLTPQERKRYHILTLAEIEAGFAAGEPCVVVLRNEISSAYSQEELPAARELAESLKTLLQTHGYVLARSIGGISIYQCRRKS